jgi:hypothetical protein
VMRSEASLRWGEGVCAGARDGFSRARKLISHGCEIDASVSARVTLSLFARAARLIARDVLAEQGRSASFPRATGAGRADPAASPSMPPFA